MHVKLGRQILDHLLAGLDSLWESPICDPEKDLSATGIGEANERLSRGTRLGSRRFEFDVLALAVGYRFFQRAQHKPKRNAGSPACRMRLYALIVRPGLPEVCQAYTTSHTYA